MRRWLTGALAAVVLVTAACAGEDPTRRTLNEHVGSIRDAAAAGDLDTAQRELDELQSIVQRAVERGELSEERARAILAAAAAVDRELTALAEPADQPPTDPPPARDRPTERDDEEEEREKKDEEREKEKEEQREKEKEEEREKKKEEQREGDEEDE